MTRHGTIKEAGGENKTHKGSGRIRAPEPSSEGRSKASSWRRARWKEEEQIRVSGKHIDRRRISPLLVGFDRRHTLYDPVPPGHDLTASVVARRETGLKPLGKKGPTGDMLHEIKESGEKQTCSVFKFVYSLVEAAVETRLT